MSFVHRHPLAAKSKVAGVDGTPLPAGTLRETDAADRDIDAALVVWAPHGMPEIEPGDDLGALIDAAIGVRSRPDGARIDRVDLADGDIVVVTSKVVSKAEGRVVRADDREQAISDETVRVVASRQRPDGGTLRIVENRLGLVMAAAGVDASNTPEGTVLLLPQDPDASARAIRSSLQRRYGVRLGVVVTDTAGRAWRDGLVDIAIGCAGIAPLDDLRGELDTYGRPLAVTVTAVADEIAAATELVRRKATGRPVAVVRGLGRLVTARDDDGPGARALVRREQDDLFREGSREAYERGYAAGLAAARAQVTGTRDGARPAVPEREGPVPADWIEHRRTDDREPVGWIRPEGEHWVAVSPLGHDLTGPVDWLAAEEALERNGLAWLAEPWTLEHDDELLRVRLVEVTPDHIVVKTDDFGAIDAPVRQFELPWPAPATLRPGRPDDYDAPMLRP